MNYLALKGEVSGKRSNFLLPGKIIHALRASNVMLYNVSSDIAYRTEEFPWAPKVPFAEMSPKPRVLFHKGVGRIALKQLQGFGNWHCMRNVTKQMDMIWLDIHFKNREVIAFANFTQKTFNITTDAIKLHGVPCVFGLPHKVEAVLAN